MHIKHFHLPLRPLQWVPPYISPPLLSGHYWCIWSTQQERTVLCSGQWTARPVGTGPGRWSANIFQCTWCSFCFPFERISSEKFHLILSRWNRGCIYFTKVGRSWVWDFWRQADNIDKQRMKKVVKYCHIPMTHPWYLWKAEFILLTTIKKKMIVKKKAESSVLVTIILIRYSVIRMFLVITSQV